MWPLKKKDDKTESAPKRILVIDIKRIWIITFIMSVAILLGLFFGYLDNPESANFKYSIVSLVVLLTYSFLLTLFSKRMMK